MNGIVFFKTKMLDKLRQFYVDEIGCEMWLDQGDCQIFKHGNLLFGFCDREEVNQQKSNFFPLSTRSRINSQSSRQAANRTQSTSPPWAIKSVTA